MQAFSGYEARSEANESQSASSFYALLHVTRATTRLMRLVREQKDYRYTPELSNLVLAHIILCCLPPHVSLQQKLSDLEEASQRRKARLNDSSEFLQFNWKADLVESWISKCFICPRFSLNGQGRIDKWRT